MPLTLKQAAEETGKSKQAIQQALKSGKISGTKSDSGEWELDPAEIFRVYAPVKRLGTKATSELDDAWPHESGDLSADLQTSIVKLTVNVDAKDKEITLLQKGASELEVDRDNWREQAQRLALTYQKPPENPETGMATPSPKYQVKLSTGQLLTATGIILLIVLSAIFGPSLVARLGH